MAVQSSKLTVNGVTSHNGTKYNFMSEFNVYVLNETAIKSVSNDGLIDLKKPFCKNLPSNTITSTNSILLSKKEMEFINGK